MAGNPLAHGQFIRYLRMCTEQEPVVVFSVFIGAIGAPLPFSSHCPSHARLCGGLAGVPCSGATPYDAGDLAPRAPTPDLPRDAPHSSLVRFPVGPRLQAA